MHYVGWSFWGMHFFWWLLAIVIIVLLVSPITPLSHCRRRETPLQLLQRRYAAGEVSTQEYEERKAKLERDATSG